MEPKLPEIGGRVVFNLLPGNRLQLAPAKQMVGRRAGFLLGFDLFSGANLPVSFREKIVSYSQ